MCASCKKGFISRQALHLKVCFIPDKLKIARIDIGSLTVVYRRGKRDWLATALQFDIVGSGKTRSAAFAQMNELVGEYLAFMLEAKEKIALFNPSAREEWEVPLKESYDIYVVLSLPAKVKELSLEPRRMRLEEIRPIRKRFRQRTFQINPTPASFCLASALPPLRK